MTDEFWKPVPGYEGLYEVSRNGDLRRVGWTTRTLRVQVSKAGQHTISLFKQGEYQMFYVARLVLTVFRGECPPGMEAGYIGERGDNRLSNLDWMTHTEVQNKGHIPFGSAAPNVKLTEDQAREIRRRYAAEDTNQYALAVEYGVTQGAVYQLLAGKTWKHIPGSGDRYACEVCGVGLARADHAKWEDRVLCKLCNVDLTFAPDGSIVKRRKGRA